MNILAKGKSSSSTSKDTRSSNEQADSIPTIRMLTNKYGLSNGSEHTVISETPSGHHYLLKDLKHHVYKSHEDVFWRWVVRGAVPVGEIAAAAAAAATAAHPVGSESSRDTDPLKDTALQLGTRMMVLAGTHPSEYRDIIQRWPNWKVSKHRRSSDLPHHVPRPAARLDRQKRRTMDPQIGVKKKQGAVLQRRLAASAHLGRQLIGLRRKTKVRKLMRLGETGCGAAWARHGLPAATMRRGQRLRSLRESSTGIHTSVKPHRASMRRHTGVLV